MGHSPNAWVTLGAVAQATERVGLMTYVTAPTFRYHPAVVAQQAATLQIVSGDRFTLGLGSGERLNEHIVGGGWPGADRLWDLPDVRVPIGVAVSGAELPGTAAFDSASGTVRSGGRRRQDPVR